jgi:hypothetical protein
VVVAGVVRPGDEVRKVLAHATAQPMS